MATPSAEHLLALAHILSRQRDRGKPCIRPDDWGPIVAVADRHLVLPGLWPALAGLPASSRPSAEVEAFLRDVWSLNVARNEVLRAQAKNVVETLQGNGIDTVVLKGGAFLFSEAKEQSFARVMVDLDLLVPTGQVTEAADVLVTEQGYVADIESDDWTYCYPPLYHAGELATIELHRDAGPQRNVLPRHDILASAQLVGSSMLIPSPTHRLVHAIFHSAVQNRRSLLGTVELRALLDLAALSSGIAGAIDWEEVRARFARADYLPALEGEIHVLRRFFGDAAPAAIPPTGHARRHANRVLSQLRWPRLLRALAVAGELTAPFARCHIEYRYGRGGVSWRIFSRGRRLAFLLATRRHSVRAKIARAFAASRSD